MTQQHTLLLCLWPSRNTPDTQALLNGLLKQQNCKPKQKQDRYLNFWEFCEFIYNTYETEDWAVSDGSPDLSGILRKASWCYKKNAPLTLYLVNAPDASALLAARDQLRRQLGYGKNSVHAMEDSVSSRQLWDKYTKNPPVFTVSQYWKRKGRIRLQRRYIQFISRLKRKGTLC